MRHSHVRKAITCRVTLLCGAREGEGTVTDLTVLGCQLETAFPVQLGETVQLRLHRISTRRPRLMGVVRWANNGKVGIELISMAAAAEMRLTLLCELSGTYSTSQQLVD